ncbi:hypothetical protein ACFFRR_003477 [Megaselia abdita]
MMQPEVRKMCTNYVVLAFYLVCLVNCVPVPEINVTQRTKLLSINDTFQQQQDGLNCLLDGILVPQATVYCEQKIGCRAIQKTGNCCPDYKCDCEKDGKKYSNGEKLVDTSNPCEVCYCQGGNIICSSVTCFQRDDCSPKFIPGKCCPDYENCPENTNKTVPVLSTTEPIVSLEIPSENPLGIQIKEITKSEEIRIVDDKQPMEAPSTQSPEQKSTTRDYEEDVSSFGSGNTISILLNEQNENSIIPSSSPLIEPVEIPHLQNFEDEEDDQSNPVNPAYPTINEEDLSIYPREQYEQEHQEPRSSSTDIVKSREKAERTDEPEYLPLGRAPGEPCLIPEFERNTTKSCHSSPQALTSSEEIEEESGSGFDREPTTPKYVNLNIDELYSGSGDIKSSIKDPKNDVDVLKLNEEDNFSASGNTEVEKEKGVAQFI